MAKETAEQKLLKIIEAAESPSAAAAKGASAAAPAASVQDVAASVKGIGVSAPGLPFIPQLIETVKGILSGKTPIVFGLKEFNRVLMAAIALFVVVFVNNFLSGVKFSKQDIAVKSDNKSAPLPENFLPEFKDAGEYLTALTRRNIFQPYEKKIVEEEDLAKSEPIKKIIERTKELKLVGISWLDSEDSASALIENTTSGVTYFLRTGEKINSVTVKKIFADAVILTMDDEELEFRL